MKIGKLSLALAAILFFGASSRALAQDVKDPNQINTVTVPRDTGSVQGDATEGMPRPDLTDHSTAGFGGVPGSHGPVVPGPITATNNLGLQVRSAALDGGITNFNVNLNTGAYTVESSPGAQPGGLGSQMIRLLSSGKLSASQLRSLNSQLKELQAANPPRQMPGAPVDGAPEFTLNWMKGIGDKGGFVSGPLNAKAATEGQPASVKALWAAVSPLLNDMNKLEGKLVKDHPYKPDPRTVEGTSHNPSIPEPPKPVDLGTLSDPAKQLMSALEKPGLIQDGTFTPRAGQVVTFDGPAGLDLKSSSPSITVSSKTDAGKTTYTISVAKDAPANTMGEITGSGGLRLGADIWPSPVEGGGPITGGNADEVNGIAGQKVPQNMAAEAIAAAAAAAAKAGTTVEGGSGIRPTIDKPNTGINQVLDRDVSGDPAEKR